MGRLTAAIFLTVLVFVGSAYAEGIHGRSADLGFTFETPKSPWCDRVVEIELSAPDTETYRRDPRAFEQALGRLRAAVLSPSECPAAKAIQVDAKVGGATVVRATMSAFSRWIIVWEPNADGRPSCFNHTEDEACKSYAEAYRLWREIDLTIGAPEVQLSTFLDTQKSTQVEWTAQDLTGQLRTLPVVPDDGASVAILAQALTENAAETCGTGWHTERKEFADGQVISQTWTCKQGKVTTNEALVITMRNGYYFVFSSRATVPNPNKLWQFNARLASALATIMDSRP